MLRTTRRSAALLGGSALALTLAACGTPGPGDSTSPAPTPSESAPSESAPTDPAPTEHDDAAHPATEVAARSPRLVLTYDGGLLVVDASTLATVADLPLEGFNRINDAGDGRHVAVSTTGGFAVLDAGTWTEAHGDHTHSYTADPALHEVILEAAKPGHVVVHDGLTAFFDDGTGQVTVVETSEWTDMVEHGHLHPIREYTTATAHHGVAVATQSGELLVTRGDDDARTGAMLLDAEGAELVVRDGCPGVHGEAAFDDAAGEELFVVGCEDGVLVLHGDHAHKLTSPDAFGRIGNLLSFEGSDIVLGDYKSDPEGGLGLSRIVVIDVAAETIGPVDPFAGSGASYTFRGLARGAAGELLVLGTDGALHVLDEQGLAVRSVPVIDAWEVPQEWQSDHPALRVLDGMAYVTDPATRTLHVVDYVTGEVWKSVEVGVSMNEIVGVTG